MSEHAAREPDLARWRRVRQALEARVARSASQRRACPACGHGVYAPADSLGERITCASCSVELVTTQHAGELLVELAHGAPQ